MRSERERPSRISFGEKQSGRGSGRRSEKWSGKGRERRTKLIPILIPILILLLILLLLLLLILILLPIPVLKKSKRGWLVAFVGFEGVRPQVSLHRR